ncbi:sentrin-specific protease 8-like isoform X2 [Rhopilema esculentum]|uniref:sentrin-specific protease 8-like isoform X2 n=1 Tax=Rhopilema esculentum TaxID=499914 RepID=UPI0031DBE491
MGNVNEPRYRISDQVAELHVSSSDNFEDMTQGAVVLSYGNSLIYEKDFQLLEPRGWINDTIVGFALEYFATEQFKDISKDVYLIAPQVSQFLKLYQGNDKKEIDDILESLDLQNKKFIIVPVNDGMSTDSISGTHWTILVYSKSHRKIVHLDSFGTYNSKHARNVKGKIGLHLEAFQRLEIIYASCPQQTNYDDCGLFAICVAEEICKNIRNGKSDFFSVSFSPEHAADTRVRLKQIILSLGKR